MKQTRTRKRQARTAKQPGRRWGMNRYSSCVLRITPYLYFTMAAPVRSNYVVLSGYFPRQGWRGPNSGTEGATAIGRWSQSCAPVRGRKQAGAPLSRDTLETVLPSGDAQVSWTLVKLVPVALSVFCASVRSTCRTPGLPSLYTVHCTRRTL